MAPTQEELSRKIISPTQIYEITDKYLQWFTGELREIFKKQWLQFKNVPWKDTPINGKALMDSGIGKAAIRELSQNNGTPEDGGKANSNLILSGQLGSWNISLLTAVLQHMRPQNETKAITQKVNVALRDIRKVNKMVYERPKLIMTVTENEATTIKLKDAMILLNIDEEKFDSVGDNFYKDTLKLTYRDLMQNQEWIRTAANYFNAGDYKKTIEFTTHALQFSSTMMPEMKLEIYNVRMRACLQDSDNDTNQRYAAVRDALEINKSDSSRSFIYDLLQVYYTEKDIPYQALHHFNKYQGSQLFQVFSGIQNTVLQTASLYKEATGYKLLVQGCNLCQSFVQDMLNGGTNDWKKLMSALDCFKRASGKTIEIGKFAYSAALVMFNSKREKIPNIEDFDFNGAVEVIRKVASERNTFPHIFGDKLTRSESARVGFAQFIIGLLYQTGQNVERNFVAAKKWYQKAANKYNMATAALTLGMMYLEGEKGVPQNRQMAKFYLQQAVARGHPLAVTSLAVLYINELNIVSGRCLIKCNLVKSPLKPKLQNEHEVLEQYQKWFLSRFVLYTLLGWNEKIDFLDSIISTDYETPHRLSKKGLTFLERIKRAELLGFEYNVKDLLEATEMIFKLTPPVENPYVCSDLEEEEHGLSEFAKGIIRLRKEFEEINKSLINLEDFSSEYITYICNKLYACLEASPSIKLGLQLCSYFPSDTFRKICYLMKLILSDDGSGASSLLKMKAGLVHVAFMPLVGTGGTDFESVKQSRAEILDIVKRSLITFPFNNTMFQIYIAEFDNKEIAENVQNIVRIIDFAASTARDSDNLMFLYYSADWHFQLYSKGVEEISENVRKGYLKIVGVDPVLGVKKAVTDYRKFLEKAPFEHPFYPIAAYSLAWAYIRAAGLAKSTKDGAVKLRKVFFEREEDSSRTASNQPMSQKEKVEIIMKAYAAGVNAEKLQLSCFPVSLAAKHLRERIEVFIERTQHGLVGQIVKCIEENDFTSLKKESWTQLFAKTYLVTPLRIFFTTNLRYRLKTLRESPPVQKPSSGPEFIYKVKDLTSFIKEFSPKSSKENTHRAVVDNGINPFGSYDDIIGYQFSFIVIDDLAFEASYAYFLAEDEEGNIIHVGVDYDSTIYKGKPYLNLEFGTQLTIIYPSYRILENADDRWIQVKKTGRCKMILTGRIDNMCRFCGMAKSTKKCAKCKRMYCSELCQKKDFKVMKHKYICEF